MCIPCECEDCHIFAEHRLIFAANLHHCKVGCKFVTIFATNNSIRKCICQFVANLIIFVICQELSYILIQNFQKTNY